MERLLTVKEVSVILRVSIKTVYLWVDCGRIRAHKYEASNHKHWVRIPESSIKSFLEGTETVRIDN